MLLAVAASIAILAATILPNQYRDQWIAWRRLIPIEGIAFLAIFSPASAAVLALLALLGIVVVRVTARPRVNARPVPEERGYSSPLALVRLHTGELFGQTLGAALALGVYEIILSPSFDLPEIGWALLLGGVVGVLGIAPSAAAVVALGFTSGTDVTLAAGIVIWGSVLGQMASSIRKYRQPEPAESTS